MDRFQDLHLFRLVVKTGSLTAAGRLLGLSPATMTARVQAIEAHYGVKLLKRTTRNLSPTVEGQLLAEAAKRVLDEMDLLEEAVRKGSDDVAGTVAITAPTDLGRQFVGGILDDFLAANPRVVARLVLTDRVLDFIESGADVAFRYGNLPDSSLVTRRIGTDRLVPCCSPDYARRHGMPAHPSALASHNCLVFLRGASPVDEWRFVVGDTPLVVRVSGNRQTGDGAMLRSWALEGSGIALKSIWEIADDVRAGRLLLVLDEFARDRQGLHLLTEGGRNLPRRVRAFVDFAVRRFRGLEDVVQPYL